MAKYDYLKRLETLKKRRLGDDILQKSAMAMDSQYQTFKMNESYEFLKDTSSVKYVIGSMLPVDDTYTKNTYAQGERVKNNLSKLSDMGYDIEFQYQGSVTNNTHIKAHSDIDILTLYCGFTTLEPPQRAAVPYQGNPVNDLCRLREDCYSLLSAAYPSVEIDNEGAKSISLKGGSLSRKVDVVPSNWYDTVKYTQTGEDYYRGVMIFDYHAKTRIPNTPFLHNKLLERKDLVTEYNYKKVVRLLKTLKADSDKDINLSSYDIAALMYHMDGGEYRVGRSPLVLLQKSLTFLYYVHEQDDYRNNLKVPDESRKIFDSTRNSKDDLLRLIMEVYDIYQDLLEDLKIKGSTINKEIVA